jgi:hypothetical protein
MTGGLGGVQVQISKLAAAVAVVILCCAAAAVPARADDATVKPAGVAAQLPSPPAGKGQVVFFRRSAFKGMAASFSIREGDIIVGKLGNGSYFVLNADPGPHEYRVISEIRDTLHMEVESGETYYVQQNMDIGGLFITSTLTPSDAEEFTKLKLKAKTAEN